MNRKLNPMSRGRGLCAISLAFVMAVSGCSKRGPIEPVANSEWFVIVAEGLSPETYRSVQEQLLQLVACAAPGDPVYLVASEAHVVLGSFHVAPGNQRAKLRDKHCGAALKAFADFCRQQESRTDSAVHAGQVGAPMIDETIAQLRASTFPVRLILVGDSVYHDEARAAWSMRGEFVISDAAIRDSSCPFYVSAQTAFEPGEVAVPVRALGASYVPVAETAIVPAAAQQRPAPLSTHASAAEANAPATLEEALSGVAADEIGIAIRWWPREPEAKGILDLDLWASDAGTPGELIFFARQQGTFGRLTRDVRMSDRSSQNYRDWECLLVRHNRLADLSVFVNAYAASMPVVCQVRLVYDGAVHDWEFEFDLHRGDGSADAKHPENSPYWKKVPLLEMVRGRVEMVKANGD